MTSLSSMFVPTIIIIIITIIATDMILTGSQHLNIRYGPAVVVDVVVIIAGSALGRMV